MLRGALQETEGGLANERKRCEELETRLRTAAQRVEELEDDLNEIRGRVGYRSGASSGGPFRPGSVSEPQEGD